jgi:uncharacterized protein (TIGR03435 family)
MRRILVCALLAAFARVALGQEFEVVSVRPNKSGSSASHSGSDRGMFTATNLTLRALIVEAYGIKDYQLEGPEWISSERFDVAAKFPGALSENREEYSAALGAMLQKMLADRFKVAVHQDQKIFAVYGLAVGKKGIKFEEVPDTGSRSNGGNNYYEGTSITMDRFAEFLARRMDLPVLDMTGLKGFYNVTLKWAPESRQSGDGKSVTADTAAGPILQDALQEQLGLNLERRKAPIKILVVDHAERAPTEN